MTRTRRCGRAALAAGLALLLAGCGGPASTATSGPTRNLEVLSWWTSGSERAALNVLFDDFRTARPGVDVRNAAVAGGGGSNAHVVLANRLLGGDPPDVWQTHPGASIKQYIDAGQIADVSSIYQRGNLSSAIRPDLRQAVSQDGKEYGVSTGAHRINMLWFNKKLLDKATVTVPAGGYTTDALLNDLAKLKAAGVVPLCLGAKDPFARAELFENTLLGVIGADGWASLTSDRLNWNGPQVRQVLGRFATMLNYADPEAGALTWDQATRKLATGDCAFESMNDSAYGELVVDGAKEGTDFGYVPYPGTDNLFLTVVDTFVMAKNAKDPQNAQAFLATIGTAPTQLAFNKQKGSTPLRTDVDVSSLSPYQQSAAKAFTQDPVLLSITHGEAKNPQFQLGFYDAIAAFAQSKDINVFNQALLDAVNQVPPPPH
ncbi:MAG: ABC transporter substrate-binding protein [Pseudonocardiaceae bacterium]